METKNDQDDGETKSILFGILCSLILSPLTFHLVRSESGSLQSDLLACILTVLLSGIVIFIVNNNLKQHCRNKIKADQNQQPKSERSIFNVFTHNYLGNISREKESGNSTGAYQRIKIDPKYFKPKFIIHELMSMWGTTYTVVTWGSVLIIGGTIVATGRLAQKIKTKCRREHSTQNTSFSSNRQSSGRNDSFTSYNSSSSSSSQNVTSDSNRGTFSKMASWTKKSFASARKKLSKFAGSGSMPQITGSAEFDGSGAGPSHRYI